MKTSNFFIPMKSAFVTLATFENKCTSFGINGETPNDDDDPIIVVPPKK